MKTARPNPSFCVRTFCGCPDFCESKGRCRGEHIGKPVVLTDAELRGRMADFRRNAADNCAQHNKIAEKLGDPAIEIREKP